MGTLSISRWAEEDRPREKMARHGASALSNAELLAILIGSGSVDDSAVELMRRILDDYRNRLSDLGKATVEELCRYKGIGPAKAITILAASELGKRRMEETPPGRKKVSSSHDSFEIFRPLLRDSPVEECWILLLNQAGTVIDRVKISHGGIASTLVDVRCVLREALLKRAVSIILCHNHPSGNTQPGPDDNRLTEALRRASETMNIRLLDHIIVAGEGYYSYADEGKL